jgi:hypothetical protein
MTASPIPLPAQAVRLVVAVSSRALFDLSDSHQVFETEGVDAYRAYQVGREEEILKPGVAFPLVRKLMSLNALLGERGRVEVILLSRNSSDTGLRVLSSARHHGLDIARAAFTGGASPYRYVAVGFRELREVGQGRPGHALVDVDLGHGLHPGVLQHLAQRPAVPAADDAHPLGGGVGEEHRVAHHLVVEEVVAGGQHHQPVDGHEVAVARGGEDLDALEVRRLVPEPFPHLEREGGTLGLGGLGVPVSRVGHDGLLRVVLGGSGWAGQGLIGAGV